MRRIVLLPALLLSFTIIFEGFGIDVSVPEGVSIFDFEPPTPLEGLVFDVDFKSPLGDLGVKSEKI